MGIPAPVAKGSLEQTPLIHVYLSIVKKGLSGTLAVWPDEDRKGQDRVLFQKGRPVSGKLLEEVGSLDRGLLPLFRRRGAYAFYNVDLVSQFDPLMTTMSAMAIAAASLRGGVREGFIERTLDQLGHQPVRIKPGTDLSVFSFIARENAFLDLLRADPSSAPDLIAVAPDPKTAKRVLYLLSLVGGLAPFEGTVHQRRTVSERIRESGPHDPIDGDNEAPPKTQGKPKAKRKESKPKFAVVEEKSNDLPPPPEGLSKEHRERWKLITETSVEIEEQNFFEMLGVDRGATAEAVKDAYFEKAKIWHPDRLPPELAELKPIVDRVFGYYTNAEQALESLEERAAYIKNVQGGGGTPAAERKVNAIVTAAMEFQKVHVFVQRKNWDEAMRVVERAIELAEEPDFFAMRAKIRLNTKNMKIQLEKQLVIDDVEKALALQDDHEDALMVRAELFTKTGADAKATKIYREVASRNPKNIEAVRFVRIADMRASGGPGASKKEDEGLMSRFFRKKS